MTTLSLWLRYDFRWWIERKRERLIIWAANRVPRWLVYQCVIRAGCAATTGKYSSTIVPEVTLVEVLQRWSRG
jgi:hypothetical protein